MYSTKGLKKNSGLKGIRTHDLCKTGFESVIARVISSQTSSAGDLNFVRNVSLSEESWSDRNRNG